MRLKDCPARRVPDRRDLLRYLQLVLQHDIRKISIPLIAQGRTGITLLSAEREEKKISQYTVLRGEMSTFLTMLSHLSSPRD